MASSYIINTIPCLGVTIGFSEAVYVVSESTGDADICIDLIGASQRSVVVTLSSIEPDSQDFQLPSVPTTLVLQSGESQVCTPVSIVNDAIVEGLESFTLELRTSDPAVDIFRMTALLNIIDDDSKLIVCYFFVIVYRLVLYSIALLALHLLLGTFEQALKYGLVAYITY